MMMSTPFGICLLSLLLATGSGVEHVTHTEVCPVWMSEVWYNESVQSCKCGIEAALECFNGSDFILLNQHCLSFDTNSQQVVLGMCPYSFYQRDYVRTLNSTVTPTKLNEAMCGPLNREGLFCSKCKVGYGIPVFSKVEDKCMRCDSHFAWPLYLALVLLPITLFYILIILFNLSATHPPLTAYIFYCQLFTQTVSNFRLVRHYFETNTNHLFLHLTWTVCDIWSLDVLRYVVPGFCLSERLTNTSALFLELVTTFYPITLILLTVVLIEMHASNFRMVVALWRPFHRFFSSLRMCDSRTSVINSLATFLLLSVVKVCFVTSSFLYTTGLKFVRRERHYEVLYVEPTLKFYDLYKQAYFVPVLILFITFILLPILLLCCYPCRAFRCALRCLCSVRQMNALFIFMDCFQGHYKNGTSGSYDYRAASSIGFIIRVLIGVRLHHQFSGHSIGNSGSLTFTAFVMIVVSLFYALVRPCKKQYMNILECLLYFAAVLLLMLILHNNYFPQVYHVILALILMPSILLAGVVAYRALDMLGAVGKVKRVLGCLRRGVGDPECEVSSGDGDPHRLTHPTEYSALLGQVHPQH